MEFVLYYAAIPNAEWAISVPNFIVNEKRFGISKIVAQEWECDSVSN
jgi:hypothetical protein